MGARVRCHNVEESINLDRRDRIFSERMRVGWNARIRRIVRKNRVCIGRWVSEWWAIPMSSLTLPRIWRMDIQGSLPDRKTFLHTRFTAAYWNVLLCLLLPSRNDSDQVERCAPHLCHQQFHRQLRCQRDALCGWRPELGRRHMRTIDKFFGNPVSCDRMQTWYTPQRFWDL